MLSAPKPYQLAIWKTNVAMAMKEKIPSALYLFWSRGFSHIHTRNKTVFITLLDFFGLLFFHHCNSNGENHLKKCEDLMNMRCVCVLGGGGCAKMQYE